MLTLCYTPGTCALATLIVLEEVGALYQLRWIDFRREQQRSAEYLALNPKARVPALITDDGVLTETPALLTYVAQAAGGEHLLPQDPFELARMNAFNSYLCSTVHVAHAHRMRGYRWVDDQAAIGAMQRKVPQSVTAAFKLIEDGLGPAWVAGEQYTVADPYLYTLARWLELDGADTAALPKVLAHRERMQDRAAVQRALRHEAGRPRA